MKKDKIKLQVEAIIEITNDPRDYDTDVYNKIEARKYAKSLISELLEETCYFGGEVKKLKIKVIK